MTFDWWTLGLQAVNFLILVWLLQHFLYKPVLAAIDARRAREAETLRAAEEARAQAESLSQSLRERIQASSQERREKLAQAETAAAEVMAKAETQARAESARIAEQAQSALAQERAKAQTALREEAAALAVTLAARLLAEAGAALSADPFLARLEAHLAALKPEERQALLASSAGHRFRLLVHPLPDAPAQARWAARFAPLLGAEPMFADAPALIAGARLDLPGAVLGADWAQTLKDAGEGLARDDRPS